MDEDHPLFDSNLKIRRARTLSEELLESKEAPPDGKPFQQKYRPDPATGLETIRLDTFPKWPPELGVTAGEIAFHLRSALDYVVYQLCLTGGGDPEKKKTAFPLSENPKEYVRRRGKKPSYRDASLANVPEVWKAVIDGLQPFKGIPNDDACHLSILNSLTKRDKHQVRLRCFTWFNTPLCRVVFKRPEVLEVIKEPGNPILKVRTPDHPGQHPKELGISLMKPDPRVPSWGTAVCFGPKFVSIEHLSWCVDAVERVVAKFEPAFE